MIVLAILSVIDFEALKVFEETVLPIIKAVGGDVLHVLEITRNDDGTGEEVHILKFPSLDCLDEY